MPDEALHRAGPEADVAPAVRPGGGAGERDAGWVLVDPENATCNGRRSQRQAAVAGPDIEESNATEAFGRAELAEFPRSVRSVGVAAAGAVDKTRHAPTLSREQNERARRR
jgi:hypothetical protein